MPLLGGFKLCYKSTHSPQDRISVKLSEISSLDVVCLMLDNA